MTRIQPHSIDAEQALLGSMLIYPNSLKTVMEFGLLASDFYTEPHKIIYQAFLNLANQGKSVDAAVLISYLNDTKQLNQIGGSEYIVQLADTATTIANVRHYSEIIQNKAISRRLIETSHGIAENTYDSQADIEHVLDEAERLILDVTRSRRTSEFLSSEKVVENVLERINLMSESKSRITGMKTGYRELDNATHGFQRGDLIILAARPSMGKTALALNFGLQIARRNNLPAAIFSLEMPAEQLMTRIIAMDSQISISNLSTGYLNEMEKNKLQETAFKIKQTKIFIDDSPTIRVSEIFSKCRRLQAEEDLGVIIIDYIQLISGNSNSENRQQQVSEISRSLKALARELKVPVIALSQLSRAVEQRGENKRPLLSDLRESGAIEQDADLVLFLYRGEYYEHFKGEAELVAKEDNDPKSTEKIELNIAKHRNGPTKTLELAFSRVINAFYDYD